MDIASRITSISEHIENAYDSIKKFGVDTSVINRNIENIANVLNDDIYSKLPTVTGSGSEFTLSEVQNGQVDDFKMTGTDLKQNKLPSEYTAVEYIQSDNECYIDTGINADYKLSLKMKMACLNTAQKYMGAIKNIDNQNYIRHHLAFISANSKIIGVYFGQTNTQTTLKAFDNEFHEYNLDVYNKKMSIDDDSEKSISYDNFDVGINYYLFARNGSGIEVSKGTYKLTYCKMYYEDNLVRDFVPCYRNSDNVAGLYDFVTDTFFTNQGTGTFTVGNDITLPNPEYPIDINVVEGRQVIKVDGKNLCGIPNQTFDFNGVNVVIQDGEITLNGTSNSSEAKYIEPINPTILNGDYSLNNIYVDGTFSGTSNFNIRNADTQAFIDSASLHERNNFKLFNFQSDTSIIFGLYIVNGTTFSNYKFKVLLSEGSEADYDYEPYHDPVSYNVDLKSENLCDGINQNFWLDTLFNTFGKLAGNNGFAIPTNGANSFKIKTNSVQTRYRVACSNTLPTETTDRIEVFNGINKDNTSATIEIDTSGYSYLIVNATNLSAIEVYSYDYKLAKIPNTDYKNRIYKDNGNWYYEKNVEKVVLDGSEYYYFYSINENIIRFQPLMLNGLAIPLSPYVSNNFRYLGTRAEATKIGIANGTDTTNSRCFIFISKLIASDTTKFKNWLSTHNTEIWYALATPVTTQITNTTLIDQLEAISVHTGTNIFTISSDNNMTPEIEITRLKQLERLS